MYKLLASVIAGAAALGAVAFVMNANAATMVTVHPADMQDWWFAEEIPNGSGALVSGPETPPLGTGSAELAVDDTGRQILGIFEHRGTQLDEITRLEYHAYKQNGSEELMPSLQMDIDTDVTDGDVSWQGRLVYEPYFTQETPTGEWVRFDTLVSDTDGGNWWFSGAPGNSECPQNNPCTWEEVTTSFPDAAIRDVGSESGATLFKAGGPWEGGFTGNVDAFSIGINGEDITYNFESEAEEVSGEIIQPEEMEEVMGTTTLEAAYFDGNDENDDDVQWAVRSESCAASTNTVLGNVDGHSDPFEWDGAHFLTQMNTTLVPDGEYCFIFNPVDDAGQPDIRLARMFVIDNEADEIDVTADLSIEKSVDNENPDEGDTLIYTLTVINNGPDTASSTVVTDSLPDGVTFATSSPSVGVAVDALGNLTWEAGDLADGESATLEVTVTVDEDTEGSILTNGASVTSQASDNNDTNDVAVVDLLIGEAEISRDDKVVICHIPPGNPAAAHTIVVGAPALGEHLAHGDVEGSCEDVEFEAQAESDSDEENNRGGGNGRNNR